MTARQYGGVAFVRQTNNTVPVLLTPKKLLDVENLGARPNEKPFGELRLQLRRTNSKKVQQGPFGREGDVGGGRGCREGDLWGADSVLICVRVCSSRR